VPEIPINLALAMLSISVLGFFTMKGRKNKNIFKRVFAGFGGIYKIIDFMNDVLNYTRLYGICLSGIVVAYVFFTLGKMCFGGSPVMWPFGILIIVIGNTLNIVIATMAAYIHSVKLQYIVYFKPFYKDGGRLMEPLMDRPKYCKTPQKQQMYSCSG